MRETLDRIERGGRRVDVAGWVRDIREYRAHWITPRVEACLRLAACEASPYGERLAALYAVARCVERMES